MNYILTLHEQSKVDRSTHTHHDKPVTDHTNTPYSRLNEHQKSTLAGLVSSHGSIPIIKTYMHHQHKIIVNDSAIAQARHDFTMSSLQTIGLNPSDSACDKLLNFFRIRDDVSFIAVTHTIESGYVTMRKGCNHDSLDVTTENSSVCVQNDEIENWRNTLKVDNGKKILVALAWMHASNFRNIEMYPEFLSADVTFGVCREQRNLLRVCSIDGRMKVFEVMNCFMPSKQFKAFNWAISVALPKLIGFDILRFTSLISSDQEDNLIRSIRSLIGTNSNKDMDQKPHMNALHRLDMYHIFVKEWKNRVSLLCHFGYPNCININRYFVCPKCISINRYFVFPNCEFY